MIHRINSSAFADRSSPYGNNLILWKNFSQDNELYQIVVEQGATKIMNRYYNRADLTNITGIVDGLNANDSEERFGEAKFKAKL